MTAGVNDMGFDPEILGPELGSEEQKIRSLRQRLLATARRAARQVLFVEDVIAGYYCAMDPATPVKVRATVLAALAYFVLPLDMVPDFIVGIGFGDDATILLGALAMVGTHMRPEHREAAKAALKDKQTL